MWTELTLPTALKGSVLTYMIRIISLKLNRSQFVIYDLFWSDLTWDVADMYGMTKHKELYEPLTE